MHRRTWRFVFFALAILAGFAAGLGYGWLIHPVGYHSIDPQTLQIDYQTDFVLMVAELYRAEGDLAMALARLDFRWLSTGDDQRCNRLCQHPQLCRC